MASSVAAILDTKPDVVLLDVHLPGGGGAEVIKQVADYEIGRASCRERV